MATTADMTSKAALVTGAASGVGRATALAMARAGADLCLVDVNEAGLGEAAGEIAALGRAALVHATDLGQAANCEAAVAAAVERFDRLDALCNVAGISWLGRTAAMPVEDWDRLIAIDLSAPFHLSRAAAPHLLAAGGAIVNVTSSASLTAQPYGAAYCAAKAGLNHLTRSMAVEYRNTPLRINAVAPGLMATNISTGMAVPDDIDFSAIARFTAGVGEVEVGEVAAMIVYLASDAGRGFHGSIVAMDRGLTAG